MFVLRLDLSQVKWSKTFVLAKDKLTHCINYITYGDIIRTVLVFPSFLQRQAANSVEGLSSVFVVV